MRVPTAIERNKNQRRRGKKTHLSMAKHIRTKWGFVCEWNLYIFWTKLTKQPETETEKTQMYTNIRKICLQCETISSCHCCYCYSLISVFFFNLREKKMCVYICMFPCGCFFITSHRTSGPFSTIKATVYIVSTVYIHKLYKYISMYAHANMNE